MFEKGQIFQALRQSRASVAMAALLSVLTAASPVLASDTLIGRAVLPAATFAEGPTSGQQLGANPINGQPVPFVNKQPVQGFSETRNSNGYPIINADGKEFSSCN